MPESLGRTAKKGVRTILKRLDLYSDYDQVIPPEIKDDEFYAAIRTLARTAPVRTVLEIGSSAGEGSTRAFVEGIHENPMRPTLFCMEVSTPRFEQLKRHYGDDPQVKCYNTTSVPLDRFPSEVEVIEFYRTQNSRLNRVPLKEVLRWLHQDIRYIAHHGPSANGIRVIKESNGVSEFGIVLIDGSEFTGSAELDEVYGAEYLLLDDICTFKNFSNYRRLIQDPRYSLMASNQTVRNGYAIFGRRDH